MKEHLREIFRRIKDDTSANNSYSYDEIEEPGSCLSLSITLKKPSVGSGLLFKKTYTLSESITPGDCRVTFMSDFLSSLLNINND